MGRGEVGVENEGRREGRRGEKKEESASKEEDNGRWPTDL